MQKAQEFSSDSSHVLRPLVREVRSLINLQTQTELRHLL